MAPICLKSTNTAAGSAPMLVGLAEPTTGMPFALASVNFLLTPASEIAPMMIASVPLAMQSSNCDSCLGRFS